VISAKKGYEVKDATANLNNRWDDLYAGTGVPDDGTRRMPLFANDVAFVPDSGVAYVTANGSDSVFRVKYNPTTSAIEEIGAGPGKEFINLALPSLTAEAKGQNPVGIVVANSPDHHLAFVVNDVSRNVSALALPKQVVAGVDGAAPAVVATTAPPSSAADQAR